MSLNRTEALAMAAGLLSRTPFSKEDAARARGYIELAESLSGGDQMLYGARAQLAAGRPVTPGSPLRAAFRSWLLRGEGASARDTAMLSEMQSRDMTSAGGAYPSSPGGYFAPAEFQDAVKAMMRQTDRLFDPEVVTTIESDRGGPMSYPCFDDTSNPAQLVTQDAQSSKIEPTLGQLSFPTCPTWRSGIALVSLELDQDSAFRFDELLARMFAIRFARGLGAANVATLLSAATIGVGPNTAPAIVGDDDSAPANPVTQVGYSDLCNLLATVDSAYLASPKCYWAMRFQTLLALWNLRDRQGRPIIPQQYNERAEPILLGKPVAVCPSMPAIGAGNSPIALGDFSYFVLRTVKNSLRVLRHGEQWIQYGQVGFQAFMRGQGGLQVAPGADCPIKVIQNQS